MLEIPDKPTVIGYHPYVSINQTPYPSYTLRHPARNARLAFGAKVGAILVVRCKTAMHCVFCYYEIY